MSSAQNDVYVWTLERHRKSKNEVFLTISF